MNVECSKMFDLFQFKCTIPCYIVYMMGDNFLRSMDYSTQVLSMHEYTIGYVDS